MEAHADGVRLPLGEFTTVKSTLTQQLAAYVSKYSDPDEPVNLDLYLNIAEQEITLVLAAQSSLDVVELSSVVERLNGHAQGLGWFVYEIISKAGTNYPIYSDATLMGICEMLWFDPDQTNAEFAERLLEENGEERDGRSDDEIIKCLTAGFRPSDAHDMIAGNDWMMGTHRYQDGRPVQVRKKPRSMSFHAVKQLLQKDMPHDLRSLVVDAIRLRKQVVRKDQRVHGATPWPEDEDEQYHGQPYGASCFAVWNWNDFAGELITHFEECEMNSGESDTVHMHFKACPDDEESVRDLVKAFKDVVAWHCAVGRVLKHFPRKDF